MTGASPIRTIESAADIAEGMAHLRRVEPRFAQVEACCGPPPLRRHADGFGALMRAIVSQQLSVAAADAVCRRLEAAGFTRPDAILAANEAALRAAGLSRQKIAYLRDLAAAGIDWEGLRTLPDEAVIARLTAVRGVGRWTAEIYLMFSLGRTDAFAAADLALQEAARMLFGLAERPREKALRALAAPWAPWRAVAARALWQWYRHARGREGVTGGAPG